MNTKKTIFTIIIVIAILLVTLCGCEQTNNTQSDNEDMVGDLCLDPAPLVININDDTDFKEEVFKHIENSKIPEPKIPNEHSGSYSSNKISEIKEFYNLDILMINGYKMFSVDIYDGVFVFYFASKERYNNKGEYRFTYDDGILIQIYRPECFEYFDASERLKEFVEAGDVLTDDNFVYAEPYSLILAQIGDTFFRIDVPEELNSYEYLRDLAFKVIETAELVVVGE